MERFSLLPRPRRDRRMDVRIALVETGLSTNHPDQDVFRSVRTITKGDGSGTALAPHVAVNGKSRDALEVDALRQRIVDTGQPQTEWRSRW